VCAQSFNPKSGTITLVLLVQSPGDRLVITSVVLYLRVLLAAVAVAARLSTALLSLYSSSSLPSSLLLARSASAPLPASYAVAHSR